MHPTRRAVLAGSLAAPFVSRSAAAQTGLIPLGSITPQTGAGGPYGPPMAKVIRAVVDEVNGGRRGARPQDRSVGRG